MWLWSPSAVFVNRALLPPGIPGLFGYPGFPYWLLSNMTGSVSAAEVIVSLPPHLLEVEVLEAEPSGCRSYISLHGSYTVGDLLCNESALSGWRVPTSEHLNLWKGGEFARNP